MKIFLLSFLLFNLNSIAAQSAKVLMSRGEVTKLLPGKRQARNVKKGELLPERTSVLTKEKSMVRLRFADGTTVNLGPMSKIIISDLPKVKANVISLLTGTIGASVNKNGNDRTKLLIKTKNSVMGVRGTKFKTGFNPVNSNTSLVTIEGNVAMSKIQNQQEVALIHESDQLDKSLNSSEVVEVKAGKFSDVTQTVALPSVPVKIAPKQYDIIAKQMGSNKTAKDVMRTENAQEEVNSLLNKTKSKQVVHRPGGYVDFNTGLYVSPAKDAVIDEKTATYTATKKIGILTVYGDYEPPKGIKLDAKKGFVLASNSKKVDADVLQNLDELNGKEQASEPWIKKHILTVRLEPILSSFESNNDYYKSRDSENFQISYEQIWNDKWESGIFIGNKTWELDKPSGKVRENSGEDGEYSMLDIRYNLNPVYTIGLSLINESFPVIQENPFWDEYSFDLEDAMGISPHFTFKLNESRALNIRYKHFFQKDIGIMSFGPFDNGEEVSVEAKSLRLTFMNSYEFRNNFSFVYDLFYEASVFKIKEHHDANMNTLGLSLGLKWSI